MPGSTVWRRIVALSVAAIVALGLVLLVSAPADAGTSKREKIARASTIAKKQIGDRYQRGGTGPSSFDCSGLVKYSYRKAGISVPRTTSQQAHAARRISSRWLRKGDLMVFHDGGRVYHVGIYVGWKNGAHRMVHASRSGVPVKTDKPWTRSWYAATFRPRSR
ncbi:MAG: C40 family peptidase [Nocardioidaceae bacterium]